MTEEDLNHGIVVRVPEKELGDPLCPDRELGDLGPVILSQGDSDHKIKDRRIMSVALSFHWEERQVINKVII